MALLLIGTVLLGFLAMTRGWLRQEVALISMALTGLVLAGPKDAHRALSDGFADMAPVLLQFTAVAVVAHVLKRGYALEYIGLLIAEVLGHTSARRRIDPVIIVPVACALMTWALAAALHNTTSILISVGIIAVIAEGYAVPARPLLCAALVASNLGGFSTRWGDTPNIIEAKIWGLKHWDFFTEILPVNLGLVMLMSAAVSLWMIFRGRRGTLDTLDIAFAVAKFRAARTSLPIDYRAVTIGIIGLGVAVVGPMFSAEHELALSGLAILLACLAQPASRRTETLLALGIETYATLAGVFVLGHLIAHSHIGIGEHLLSWLEASGMSLWAIATASYLGTLLTEAASWASAVAPLVYAGNPSREAAWALGAGICAGSSSLVTAASAGIILTRETADFKDDARITFGSYIAFGVATSLSMLAYYVVVLAIVF